MMLMSTIYNSKFGSKELDLLVLDSDLLFDGDPLVNEPQTEIGESQNMQCNVVMLPTQFKKSKDQLGLQNNTTSWAYEIHKEEMAGKFKTTSSRSLSSYFNASQKKCLVKHP